MFEKKPVKSLSDKDKQTIKNSEKIQSVTFSIIQSGFIVFIALLIAWKVFKMFVL